MNYFEIRNMLLAAVLCVAVFATMSKIVNAVGEDSPIAIRISPLSYDLVADPGEEKTGNLYIENVSRSGVEVEAEYSNFFIDGQGEYIFTGEKEVANENLQPYLMSKWFSISEKKFFLEAGESKIVEYKILVPEDAVLGGHYGAIFFKTICSDEKDSSIVATDKSNICVSGRVGTLFLTQVGGTAVKRGVIKKIDFPKLSLDEKEKLSIEIQNAGNTHFRPEGQIIVKNLFGQEIKKIQIKDKTILPTLSRIFSEELKRADLAGFYRIQGSIKDGEGREMIFKRYIFMPPWKEASITVLIAGALFWFFKKFRLQKIGK